MYVLLWKAYEKYFTIVDNFFKRLNLLSSNVYDYRTQFQTCILHFLYFFFLSLSFFEKPYRSSDNHTLQNNLSLYLHCDLLNASSTLNNSWSLEVDT